MAAPKVDILVNLLAALQPDPAVTTIPLNDADQPLDYSRLLGQKVVDQENLTNQLISSLNSLYSQVLNLQTAYTTLTTDLGAGDYTPQVNGVYDVMPTSGSYPVEQVLYQVCIQFIAMRDALGTATQLSDSVGKQDVLYTPALLKEQSPLSTTSYTVMNDFPDWISDPTKVADTINNMWITINDMRLALSTIVDPASPVDCSSITVAYTATLDSVNKTIRFFFMGNCNIPASFNDVTSGGTLMEITDGSNIFNAYINLKNAASFPNGYVVSFSDSAINPYLPLTTTYTYALTNGTLTCADTISPITVPVTANVIPQLTVLALSATSVQVIFQPIATNDVDYRLKIYDSTGTTLIDTSPVFSNPTGTVSHVFATGLVTARTYQVELGVNLGSTTYTSQFYSVQTL